MLVGDKQIDVQQLIQSIQEKGVEGLSNQEKQDLLTIQQNWDQSPSVQKMFESLQINVPDLDIDVDPETSTHNWSYAGDRVGASMTAIMICLHEANQDLRKAYREARQAMGQIEVSAAESAAEEIRNQVGPTRWGGCIGGGLTAASGAMGVYGAAKAGYTASGKGNIKTETFKPQLQTQRAQLKTAQNQANVSEAKMGTANKTLDKQVAQNEKINKQIDVNNTKLEKIDQKLDQQTEIQEQAAVDKAQLKGLKQKIAQRRLDNATEKKASLEQQKTKLETKNQQLEDQKIDTTAAETEVTEATSQFETDRTAAETEADAMASLEKRAGVQENMDRAQRINDKWRNIGMIGQGIGQGIQSWFEGTAKSHEADKAEYDAQAANARIVRSDVEDSNSRTREDMTSIRQKLDQILQSEGQLDRELARVRQV